MPIAQLASDFISLARICHRKLAPIGIS